MATDGTTPLALITGASSGIGEAMAWELARAGYGLLLSARRGAVLDALAAQIRARHGVPCRTLAADLAQPGAPAQIAAFVEREGLAIDLLVNNAGVGLMGAFSTTDWARERDILQVNVTALTELTKRLLPAMRARGRGRILNVASTAGFVPGPLMAVYYASKAYVVSFSVALANELRGTGITVTALCPGATRTGFEAAANAGQSRLFRWTAGDVQAVARAGVRGALAGRSIVAPGLLAKVTIATSGLGPRWMVAAIARFLNAPA